MRASQFSLLCSIALGVNLGSLTLPTNPLTRALLAPVAAQIAEDHKAEADRLFQQSLQQFQANQFQDAFQSLQEALQIYRGIQDRSGEANALLGLGRIFELLSQYPQALEFYQQALTSYRAIEDRRGEGTTLNNIGLVYQSLGQYPQALEHYQQALLMHREVANRPMEGTTLNNIGLVYDSLGQYPQALEHYQQALLIHREVVNRPMEGTTLNNIGAVYKSLGQYPQALEHYRQALLIAREIGNRIGEGTTLNNIGLVYQLLGQYSQALEHYQQALLIAREVEDRAAEGTILNNIGLVYQLLEQYPQALEHYQQALLIAREIGNRTGEGIRLNNIGAIYQSLGQYPQALEYYQQTLVIHREVGNRPVEGTTLNNIGLVYQSLGQYPQALEHYQQALTIAQAIGDRAGEGIRLNNIGHALEAQNQNELAIVFLKQSVNTFENIRADLRVLSTEQQQSYTETVADTYRKLADLLLQNNRVLEAQRILDLLKVQELEDYLQNVRGNAQTASGVAFFQPEQDILTRHNELQQTAIQIGQERAELAKKAQQTALSPAEQQRKEDLVKLEQALNQQFNDFAKSDEVRGLIEKLDFEVREQTISMGALDGLRDKLGQLDAALLYPLILDDRIELIITTPNSPPLRRTIENVGRAQLNEAIVALRQALEDPTADATTPAHQLYQWLIEPIEADLRQANIKTIIYAPDGQLRYIPLAALYDGEQWLVQRFRVNNITAASLQELVTQPPAAPHVLAGAFADQSLVYPIPVGSERVDFRGLPFAGAEVATLGATVPNSKTLVDQAFSLSTVQPLFDQYNILHFATHAAVVPGDASQSFILFGDGKTATLRDIESWSLNNVDLVVLSACETGLGGFNNNGEQILGLGYQFQNRGARAVIASLWSVNDQSTELLMSAFYHALKQGMSKAAALQAAQTALISNDFSTADGSRGTGTVNVIDTRTGAPIEFSEPLSHPYYWAPFILIGNGL